MNALTVVVAMIFTTSCSGKDGLVIVDLCTPQEAANPLQDGVLLRISSSGEIERSVVFDLLTEELYREHAVFPKGVSIALVVEVIDAAGEIIARGETSQITVGAGTNPEEDRVCACLSRIQRAEMEHCLGVGCVYNEETDRCVFFALR